jgi:hypothetical protein
MPYAAPGRPSTMPEWQSRRHLEDHFAEHGREVGARTIDEYDASARALITRDDVLIFGFVDDETGLDRVGLYDEETRLFTVLSDDDRWMVTHFRTRQGYIDDLLGED